jgi:hypothetical protein
MPPPHQNLKTRQSAGAKFYKGLEAWYEFVVLNRSKHIAETGLHVKTSPTHCSSFAYCAVFPAGIRTGPSDTFAIKRLLVGVLNAQ